MPELHAAQHQAKGCPSSPNLAPPAAPNIARTARGARPAALVTSVGAARQVVAQLRRLLAARARFLLPPRAPKQTPMVAAVAAPPSTAPVLPSPVIAVESPATTIPAPLERVKPSTTARSTFPVAPVQPIPSTQPVLPSPAFASKSPATPVSAPLERVKPALPARSTFPVAPVQPIPSTQRRDAKAPSRMRPVATSDGVAGAPAASKARKGPGDSLVSAAAELKVGVCRMCKTEGICHTKEKEVTEDTLLAPCACSGTSGLVHRRCLFVWQRQGHVKECELCHSPWR
jgi:hypothetical protein